MSIFKKCNRKHPYTLINKTLLSDRRLTLQAKGLLSYLLSLPDDWNLQIKEVISHSKNGIHSHYATINELIKYKYIYRKEIKSSRGLVIRMEYLIFDEPTPDEEANTIFNRLWPPDVTNTHNKGLTPVEKAEKALKHRLFMSEPLTEDDFKHVFELRILHKKEGDKLFNYWKNNEYKINIDSIVFKTPYSKWKENIIKLNK